VVQVGRCMAFKCLEHASGHLPTFGICAAINMGDPSHVVAFHRQRLGQMVSHRRGANGQDLCNLSR
jgi:hypothetical protein